MSMSIIWGSHLDQTTNILSLLALPLESNYASEIKKWEFSKKGKNRWKPSSGFLYEKVLHNWFFSISWNGKNYFLFYVFLLNILIFCSQYFLPLLTGEWSPSHSSLVLFVLQTHMDYPRIKIKPKFCTLFEICIISRISKYPFLFYSLLGKGQMAKSYKSLLIHICLGQYIFCFDFYNRK